MKKQFRLQTTGADGVHYAASIDVGLRKQEGTRKTIHLTPTAQPWYWEFTASCSITGSDRSEYGGQCLDHIEEIWGEHLPTNIRRVIELWKRWHLNGLNAGTRAQRDFLQQRRSRAGHYDDDCRLLEEHGLLIDRGYRYGSAWLVEELPAEIVEELTQLLGDEP